MLGEEDLNPAGSTARPGARVPSMMSPTVVLRDGAVEVALGSAGSNRIRSAIVQTIAGVRRRRARRPGRRRRPRLHVEDDLVDAEPGVDEEALAVLEEAGWRTLRWEDRNLYFGGVQAVARNARTAS